MRFYRARKQINEKQIKQNDLVLIDAVQFADLRGCYFHVGLSHSLERTYILHFYRRVLKFHCCVLISKGVDCQYYYTIFCLLVISLNFRISFSLATM